MCAFASYDLILDNAGTRSIADRRRVLSPDGTLVVVGGPETNRWLGPLPAFVTMIVAAKLGSARMVPFLARLVKEDLVTLRDLLEAGTITPVIDATR